MSIPIATYISLTLAERRDYYIEKEPKFLALEEKLYSYGGSRLIYMPSMWFVDKLLSEGLILRREQVVYRGLEKNRSNCHIAAINHWCKHKSQLVTGFYLKESTWRQHTWVVYKNKHTELTPNLAQMYYGLVLDGEYAKKFFEIYINS